MFASISFCKEIERTNTILKLRDLEIALQGIKRFSGHRVEIESYPTPASIAAAILFSAQMDHDDIHDCIVCDLGCGDGIFANGAALLAARAVVGIDIQSKALKVAQENSSLLGTEDIVDLILGDVASLHLTEAVDTVVSNPPFGVQRRGADLVFLKKAMSISRVVYSIHLAGKKNRRFLKDYIQRFGGKVTQLETFDFPISRIYDFHRKPKHIVNVDLYRICVHEREIRNG